MVDGRHTYLRISACFLSHPSVNHLNAFLCSRAGMSMGESVMLHDAWLLLKDFSFRRNLPEDYYNTLADRMVRQIEARRPLEHVNAKVTGHYRDQKELRYHPNQALPKEMNIPSAKKYKFTLEDILNFMANDVVSQHPELKEAMGKKRKAPSSEKPDREPSMHFDALQTSRPKDTNSVLTPHFDIDPRSGKLQLKTVGHGMLHDKSRQSIHAKPTTSPIMTDTHSNATIDENLPQRFNFTETETPPRQPDETESPIEPKDPYAGFPPALAEQMRQRDADNANKSEPMEIAMRLLKRDLSEMTDYEIDRARFANDNPELQSEERTRAMDRMAEFSRQNVTPFDYGDEVEEAYDDIGDQDHSDYFGEDIDPNELYQYILENAGQEAAQNYVQQYKDARAKYGGNAATMGQLDNYGISNQGDANDFIESRERMTGDMRNIMPNDETVFDAYPYPEGVLYNNKLSPPFTTTPQNESNFQMKYTGAPMDIAMRLLKAPYDIDGEVHDRLYQGGREGDPDSGYWPSSHQEALTYAMMGSDQDMGMRTDGVPQIRIASETDKMHYLKPDPETNMVGMAEKNAFPHEIQSRQETAGDIEQLLSQLKDDPYADDDEDYPYNESQSEIAPFMDTGARDVSNAKRIAHIEEMHNRVKTGEPMDIALRLLKNFVLEPDNPEQAYFQSSMGYHPETGKVGYVPNTEVDPLNDVRINLASPKQFMLRDRDGNPVDDGAGFDQFVQRVGKDLLHEHTHGAIDREIRQAYLDKILPSENVFSAHEVGAIAAQNPGEGFANQRGADRVSENETRHHPSTRNWRAEQSPFADGRWSPQPAYSSNSEEGYE